MSDLPQDLPVLVYGRGKDEEPFREETNAHLLNLRGGLITLATSVEPGQQLILMNVVTEEDQRCRVAFVRSRRFLGKQSCQKSIKRDLPAQALQVRPFFLRPCLQSGL